MIIGSYVIAKRDVITQKQNKCNTQFCFFDGLVSFPSSIERSAMSADRVYQRQKQIMHVVIPLDLVFNLTARVVTVVLLPYSGGEKLRRTRSAVTDVRELN